MAVRISDLTEDTTPNADDVIPIVDTGAGVTKKVKAKVLVDTFMPTGMLVMWATLSAPSGWLLCDGSSVSRVTYADLFAIIGTTYGSADGSHFNVPNMKGKVPVGRDSGQTEFDNLADAGGEKTHTLTTAELATHTHGIADPGHSHGMTHDVAITSLGNQRLVINGNAQAFTFTSIGLIGPSGTGISVVGAGSGTAHNNLQPYVTVNYIIKA